jgi:hypothetical protein
VGEQVDALVEFHEKEGEKKHKGESCRLFDGRVNREVPRVTEAAFLSINRS